MRMLATAALAGTILAGAMSTSQAARIAIPLIGGSGSAMNTNSPVSGDSTFTDAFTFTVLTPFKINFSLQSALVGGSVPTPSITSASFGLYQGAPTITGGIGTATFITPISTVGSEFAQTAFYASAATLSAGSYFFELATSTSGGEGATSSLTNSVQLSVSAVSAVPIPATLPMFGAALLGLGAAGFVMRRRGSPLNPKVSAPA